ncbi:HLH-domain-containing protein [Xylariaceae sp. FL0804]|nr:HLH-domain-containing protein [Xylariaceae sp. FL0804]
MDAGVSCMQDIDVYHTENDKSIGTIFDAQQLSSVNFWDDLDRSADSSFVNSAAASIALNTPSTNAAISPVSTSSAYSNPTGNGPNHSLSGKQQIKKRRRSDKDKKTKVKPDPSPLDCSDYWLRFDSDSESIDNLYGRESQEDAHVRFPSVLQTVPERRAVGSPGAISKVALPPAHDLLDDSALDHALSDEDDLISMALAEHLKTTQSSTNASEQPPRERLYSTPLSWEPPQPGFHMDYFNTPSFSDPERQRLLAIALGTGQAPAPADSRPQTALDFRFELNQSPRTMSDSASNTPEPRTKPPATRPQPPSRTASFDLMEGAKDRRDKPRNSDRAAHNDIERKYRTNLKDRIAELRDAIPSLRAIPEDDGDNSPATSSRTAPKVSKGTVLTKATEYIHQLERRNRSVAQKNEELSRRLQAFEQLVGAAQAPGWQPQSYGGAVFNPRFS